MLEELIEIFAKKYDLPYQKGANKDEEVYFLPINEEMTIELRPLNPGVYFRAKVALFLESDRESFFIHLMKANFLSQGTGEGRLGMDPDERLITYSRYVDYHLSPILFEERLEEFCNWLDHWTHKIEKKE